MNEPRDTSADELYLAALNELLAEYRERKGTLEAMRGPTRKQLRARIAQLRRAGKIRRKTRRRSLARKPADD